MTEENRNTITKYSKGKIYVIRNNEDDDLYVGSTTQPLSKRFYDHKQSMRDEKCMNSCVYKKMNELGLKNFYIELYESFPCQSKEELLKREGEVIREIGTLNKQVAGRKYKEWAEDNSEKVKGYKNKYNFIHKEELRENREDKKEDKALYDKEYRAKNRKQISENRSVKVQCECGSMISKANLSRHQKSEACKANL